MKQEGGALGETARGRLGLMGVGAIQRMGNERAGVKNETHKWC